MARHRYNFETKSWEPVEKREAVPIHAVWQDSISATESHADGKTYTSRSKMFAAAAAEGCEPISSKEAIEMRVSRRQVYGFQGRNDALRNSIERAYYDLRDGRIPTPEPRRVDEVMREITGRDHD